MPCQRGHLLKLVKFVRVSCALKNVILLTQPSTWDPNQPPHFLPPGVVATLARACTLSENEVLEYWDAHREEIWLMSSEDIDVEQELRTHGAHDGLLSARNIFPPVLHCINNGCKRSIHQGINHRLYEAHSRAVVLFTADAGPLVVHYVHFLCNGCKAIYHQNYAVFTEVYGGKLSQPDGTMKLKFNDLYFGIPILSRRFTDRRADGLGGPGPG